MKRAYLIAAIICTAFSLGLGYWCTRIRWASRIDFDVVGLLWLMQNVVPVSLIIVTLGFAGAAIYCWVRARSVP
jgi:hypothetical protein